MPDLVPTISVTVIREGKRVTVEPNKKSFPFTAEEVKTVTAVHPTAFRKPVNETPTDATAPDTNAKPKATTAPKRTAKQQAAQADSQSDAATEQTDQQSGEAGDTNEDDDI